MPQAHGAAAPGTRRPGSRSNRTRQTPLTIAEKELRGVGERLERPCITFFCDNQVVVASLSSKTSKHPGLMYLIRCLVFVEVKLNFTLQLRYINTREIF